MTQITSMMCSTSLRALALVLVEAWLWSVVMVRAELVPRAWEPNQINQTLCWWEQPRGAALLAGKPRSWDVQAADET